MQLEWNMKKFFRVMTDSYEDHINMIERRREIIESVEKNLYYANKQGDMEAIQRYREDYDRSKMLFVYSQTQLFIHELLKV